MKAEKVLGIVACAIVCVTGSAFANTTTNWFGVTASPAEASEVTIKTNEVTVAIANIVADSKITLDGDTTLTFAPTETDPARSDNLVTISSSAVLTPNAVGDLPPSSELGDAQIGFAVAYNGDVTNYYYYASGAWTAGAGTPPADPTASVTFTITLDYRTNKAKFEVGSTVVAADVTFIGAKLNTVAALGSGSLTEVSAKYEIAVAEYGNVKYGSVSDAMTAAGSSENYDSIAVVDDEGSSTGGTGEAANGLEKWECAALQIDEAEQVVLAKSAKQNAGKITLAVQNVTPESGLTVKYGVSVDGGAATGSYDADDIQIPMGEAAGSHTYKIVPTITATAN